MRDFHPKINEATLVDSSSSKHVPLVIEKV